MKDDRYSVSHHETNDIKADSSVQIPVSYPQTSGNLAIDSGLPTCGTPPDCAPVTPAAGCITSLIDFQALNERRKQTGKSYQTIADALDMSKATVSRFFSGQAPNPSLYNTIRIFDFLGLSIDEAAGIAKPSPVIETDHDLQQKVSHLEYVIEVKDKHIEDLEQQLSVAVEMREKYKKFFTEELERQHAYHEHEIQNVRARADKHFRLLFTLIIVLLSALLAYTIADLCLADIGLFQYTALI